jgi:O-antigen ligase
LLKYFFFKNEITFFFKKYFLILISIFIFIFFDLIFQKITGVDFFGYKSTIETNINRLTGPFGNNEYIPGSYIFHICTPAIVYFIYNISHKNLFLRFFIITSITNFYLLSIFITGERTSFLLATLSLIILIFIKKNFRKELVFALVTSFLLIFFFSANNSYYKDRYLIFKDTVIGKEIDNSKRNNFLDSQWGAHYLTALEIFKKNILFGSGARSYRIECHKEEYNKINSRSKDIRCSTHPHNFYLELLAETGIISFVVFLIYLLNSIVSSFKILFYKKELTIFISFFVIFLSIIWPIRATGSILSNFAGSMIWLNFAFLSAINFRVSRTNI